jgi:hypothetical protein
MQASNKVNWPLYAEVAPTYYGPLGKHQVQEMWIGGAIFPPYSLSMPSAFSSAWLVLTDIRWASIRSVLVLTVWSGLFEGP